MLLPRCGCLVIGFGALPRGPYFFQPFFLALFFVPGGWGGEEGRKERKQGGSKAGRKAGRKEVVCAASASGLCAANSEIFDSSSHYHTEQELSYIALKWLLHQCVAHTEIACLQDYAVYTSSSRSSSSSSSSSRSSSSDQQQAQQPQEKKKQARHGNSHMIACVNAASRLPPFVSHHVTVGRCVRWLPARTKAGSASSEAAPCWRQQSSCRTFAARGGPSNQPCDACRLIRWIDALFALLHLAEPSRRLRSRCLLCAYPSPRHRRHLYGKGTCYAKPAGRKF